MKVVLTLVTALVVICLGVYFLGGYHSFDPSEEGRNARAALTPGMTWTEALEITGEPRHYHPIVKEVGRFGGEEIVSFRLGPRNKFSREGVASRLADNTLPDGFVCVFVYSGSVAFRASFDSAGILEEVGDAPTTADLFQLGD